MLGRKICFLILFLFTNAFAQAPDFAADLQKKYEATAEPAALEDFMSGDLRCSYFCSDCNGVNRWSALRLEVHTYREVEGDLRGQGPLYPDYGGTVKREVTGLVPKGHEYKDSFLADGISTTKIEGIDLVWNHSPFNYRHHERAFFRRHRAYIHFKYQTAYNKSANFSTYYGYCWPEKN